MGIKRINNRYKKALEIILNKRPYGASFLWAEMMSIAEYALTGKDSGGQWHIEEKDKILIDNADKIPVIWGRNNGNNKR